MRRHSLSPGKDRAIFRHSAVRTKAVNLGVVTARGGIRL